MSINVSQRRGQPMTYAEARRGSTNRSMRSIASMYSATFGANMLHTAQLRTLMEEEEIKGMLQKKKGRDQEFEQALEQNDELANMNYHKLGTAEILQEFDTDEKAGLSDAKASRRMADIGPNKLKEKKPLPWYIKLILEMCGIFSILLWAGALLCFVAYGLDPSDNSNLYLGIVIVIVVVVTGIFTYYQNSKSEAIMAKFKNLIPPQAKVWRNGVKKSLDATLLVPGDIIEVDGGDKIPADIRIIEAKDMKVNNSSLTGESEHLLRDKYNTKEKILEAENMAFFGTNCEEGHGKAVVVLTGPRTIMGRIATLAQSAEQGETTLSADLHRFMKLIATIAVTLGILFFAFGFIYETNLVVNFIYAIGIIVANVPEGLLITLTITLAATANRLGENNVLVKNLQAVETLGSTSCICSDKTGTLTQNRMSPAHAFISCEEFNCAFGKDEYEQFLREGREVEKIEYEHPMMQKFAKYLAMCSTAELADPTDLEIRASIAREMGLHSASEVPEAEFNKRKEEVKQKLLQETLWKDRKAVSGNATEVGMVKFISSFINYRKCRDEFNEAFGIPFNSALKYNLVIKEVVDESGDFMKHLVLMKGAAEKVVLRCNKVDINGTVVEMTEDKRKLIDQKNNEYASHGERVLGLAYLDLNPEQYPKGVKFISEGEDKNVPTTGLVFLGLMSLMDPPRIDVEKSVDKCRNAGIKVIMVTGDQPETAKAIAHKCHIITNLDYEYGNMLASGFSHEEAMNDSRAIVIHGDELARMHKLDSKRLPEDPEKGLYLQQWLKKKEVVFARMNPAQKLIIVDACQKLGYIVAVTGDGVNDSPAIEKANIGIAMGSGSEVAKDVADMVLLTDDFTSIVIGVEQGRLIFDNLKKSIVYTLASNIPELIPFLLYIAFQIPLPLTTILILFVDIGTDLWPAISFAYEPAELDIMSRKPRIPGKDLLVSKKVIIFAYLQIGIMEAFGAMFAYFVVMMDYGFKPLNLFFYAFKEGCVGNEEPRVYDWISRKDSKLSVMEFYSCPKAGNLELADPSYYVPVENTLDTISPITNEPVRYTSEALKYAQTAVWAGIVVVQWANLLVCKTRSVSIGQQGFSNRPAIYGLIFETALALIIIYVPYLHEPLGTRPLDPRHLGVPVFPFFTLIFAYDEIRKYLMHKLCRFASGKRPQYSWLYRNTFY